MNKALIERYRCLERFAQLKLQGELSLDAGFFRFGDLICNGRSTSGYRRATTDALYDVINDDRTEDSEVTLPFDPSEVIENLQFERYKNRFGSTALSRWERSLRNAYYALRPWMNINVRKHIQRAYIHGHRRIAFPHWPVDTTVEELNEKLFLRRVKANGVDGLPFIWFWPDGAKGCVVMTHDVEEREGLDFCHELMDMNEFAGIKASFLLIPERRYQIAASLVKAIRSRGFELNIHDLNHDGRLFRNSGEFVRRAATINKYGRVYGARGFRSGALYRNQDWYDALEFSFDMFVPNVAHLDPQRGGCCTVTPYFIGNILEIPLTTTQDYMLFHLLNDFSLDLWIMQTRTILERNGLVSFLVHPDYVIESRARAVYCRLSEYLRQLRSSERLWFALPSEVDEWWRARRRMRVVERDGQWRIEGRGAERAKLAFPKASDDRLQYEVDFPSTSDNISDPNSGRAQVTKTSPALRERRVSVHQLDPLRDPRWREFLDRHPCASVFHTPEWLEALRRTYGYSSVVLTTNPPGTQLSSGLVYCPVNSWLTGRRLVSLPFSDHCEPLADNKAELCSVLSTLEQELRHGKFLYVEIRPNREIEYATSLHCSTHAYCFHQLDLKPDLHTLFGSFHKDSTQRKVRRAEREGLVYTQGREQSLLDVFYRLLVLTRRRHGLPPQPRMWFRNLIDCFGEGLKIRVAFKNNLPVAAILTIRNKQTLLYKYGCSDKQFHNLGGIHFLLWRAIQEAKEDRLRVLDFGRSDLENAGLIKFKDRWGCVKSVMTYCRFSSVEHLRGNFLPPNMGWTAGRARRMLSHLPDFVLCSAGDLLYRHLG